MNAIQEASGFLSKPFNKWLVVALVVLGAALLAADHFQQQETSASVSDEITVHFFYLPTCPHCSAQKPFNEKLIAEYPEVEWVYHDVSKPEEAALLAEMAGDYGLNTADLEVPTTFFKRQAIVGFDNEENTGAKLRAALESCLNECVNGGKKEAVVEKESAPQEIDLPLFGKIISRITHYPHSPSF